MVQRYNVRIPTTVVVVVVAAAVVVGSAIDIPFI